MHRRRLSAVLTGTMLLLAMLVGCGGTGEPASAAPPDGTLRIATGTTAGVYYLVGLGMADVFERTVPDVEPEVLVTGGGPENIRLLLEGKAELAFVQAGVLYNALSDPKTGAEAREKLRGLTYLYPNVMHLVVRKDAGIYGPADIIGKRFIPGPRESAAEINAAEILSIYNVKLTDTRLSYHDYNETAQALIEGSADGAMIPGGLQTPTVVRMMESGKVKILPLDASAIMQHYHWYEPFTIPADTYPNQDKSVQTVAVANVLVARADLSDDLVYQLVEALYKDPNALSTYHSAAVLNLDEAMRGMTGVIEPHPGAARFLQEAGVLQ